jgi:hypothetical protein
MGPTQLLVLQYHSGDSYATGATEARIADYGNRGFPTILFDGANPIIGAGSEASAYTAQTAAINKELAKVPAVAITETMTVTGGIKVTATIANTSSAAINGAQLRVVLYEDIGANEHHYAVRDILTPIAVGTLAPGAGQQFTVSSTYSGSTSKLNAVVFIQGSNGDILQAALATK